MRTHICTNKSLLGGVIVTVLLLLFLESTARVVEFIKPQPESMSKLSLPPKPKDSFRIMVYGGSTVEGLPINEFSFVSQLEFWLREIHPEKPLEVYNLGKAGVPSAYVCKMVEKSIIHDPDLLIVLSGHNEFLSRRIESLSDKILASFALTRALVRILNWVQTDLFPLPENVVMPIHEGYHREASLFKKKVQAYLENLRNIVETARRSNKPVLLLTAPSNISDWPPAHKMIATSGYEEEYKSWIAEVDRFLADGRADRALVNINKLPHTYDNDPLRLYLKAKAYAAEGEYDHARTLYTKAKDLDPLPWRVLTDFNQAVRELAKLDGVFLVDVEKRFQQQARHGLVGFSLIADNCHPTPLGNAIISRGILALMRQKRLFVEKELGHLSIGESLEYFFLHTTTPDKRRSLEMSYLLKNAKYAMKAPFFNFKASRMYLEKALAMDSLSWEVWVNLATLALFENRIEEGRLQLKRAIQLRGVPIDQNDRRSAPYLKEALERSGIRLQEIQ